MRCTTGGPLSLLIAVGFMLKAVTYLLWSQSYGSSHQHPTLSCNSGAILPTPPLKLAAAVQQQHCMEDIREEEEEDNKLDLMERRAKPSPPPPAATACVIA